MGIRKERPCFAHCATVQHWTKPLNKSGNKKKKEMVHRYSPYK